jgi:hypothetical protein
MRKTEYVVSKNDNVIKRCFCFFLVCLSISCIFFASGWPAAYLLDDQLAKRGIHCNQGGDEETVFIENLRTFSIYSRGINLTGRDQFDDIPAIAIQVSDDGRPSITLADRDIADDPNKVMGVNMLILQADKWDSHRSLRYIHYYDGAKKSSEIIWPGAR